MITRDGLVAFQRSWVKDHRSAALLGYITAQTGTDYKRFISPIAFERWKRLDDHLGYASKLNGVSVRDIFAAVFGQDEYQLRDDMFLFYVRFLATRGGFNSQELLRKIEIDDVQAELKKLDIESQRAVFYSVLHLLYQEGDLMLEGRGYSRRGRPNDPFRPEIFFSKHVEGVFKGFSHLIRAEDFVALTQDYRELIVVTEAPSYSEAADIPEGASA